MAAQTERAGSRAGREAYRLSRACPRCPQHSYHCGIQASISRDYGRCLLRFPSLLMPPKNCCRSRRDVAEGIGAHTKRGSPPFLARTSEMKGTPMVRALPTTTCSERWHRPQQPAVLSRRCVCPRASRPAPRRQHLRSLRGERMHRSLTRICRCTTSSRSRSSCAAAAHGFVSPAPCSHTLPSSRRCSWLCR